jgi:signal transduction histidine kinase
VPGRAARLTPPAWVWLGVAATIVTVGAEAVGGVGMPEAIGDGAAGVALLFGGLGARSALMAFTGATWVAGDLIAALLYAHRGPLTHLLLTYPSGRIGAPALAALIGSAYVDGFVPGLARSAPLTIALSAAIVVASSWRYRTAQGLERRARAAPLAGAIAIGGTLGSAALARLAGAQVDTAAVWAYEAAVALTAIGLAVDLSLRRWERSTLTGLVVDLGNRHEPRALQAALARALADPELQIAYRVPDKDTWVDELGRTVTLPAAGGDRSVTLVRDDGRPIAALIHDPNSLVEDGLTESVAAIARLAVVNARMQADVAASVRDVEGSRRRLLETGDEERRRFGAELEAGIERRLATLSAAVGKLAAAREGDVVEALSGIATDLDEARDELRRFALGVHPRVLTEQGLAAAVQELVAQSPVSATVSVTERRLPPAHEVVAFFVCSEGLANVAKHAGGGAHAALEVTVVGHTLVVRVVDDGSGGVDPARGTGLRGLTDRVEALGGVLRVDSAPGAGTRLEAELPVRGTEAS